MKNCNHFAKLSALLLLLMLATLGMAYGQWTEALSANGTVTTGEVNVDFVDFDCHDNESLASIGAVLNSEKNTLQMSVDNAYPGYVGRCSTDFVVRGTLPVYIKSIDFAPGGGLTGCSTTYSASTGSFTAACKQMEIVWTNGLCRQFATGEGEGSNMRFTLLADAEESTAYQFAVTYTLEQATGSNNCIRH
jgi:hypothetical protein